MTNKRIFPLALPTKGVIKVKLASRLAALPTGIFSQITALIKEAEAQGQEVIDLSVGSPDMPPPPYVKEALLQAIQDDTNYGYTLTEGIDELKEAVVNWYQKYYGVTLHPTKEVLPLMGSQDGLAHIHWALLDPGDVALVPDPGYPIYYAGVQLVGGKIYPVPLLERNHYLPDFKSIPAEVCQKAKVMILNYPSNPVAATATREFFEQAVEFAKKEEIIILHDFAYSEISYDGFKNTSFLEIPGAKEVGIEFHSVSKTFNLAGCRLGFICGNEQIVAALRQIKSNIDYGTFRPIQLAAAVAFNGEPQCVKDNALAYERRRDTLIAELAKYGWEVNKPKASMFVWAKLPPAFPAAEQFVEDLIREAGVAVVPGTAFGPHGEGYVRIGLVQDQHKLKEAGRRMGEYITTRVQGFKGLRV